MTRIVVKNTVDMRMLSMQLHKLQSLEKVHYFLFVLNSSRAMFGVG